MRATRIPAVLVSVVLVAVAAGCSASPSTGPGGTGQPGSSGPASSATTGGDLVFRTAWQEPTQPLDARQATTGSTEIASNLFEGLLKLNADGTTSPLGASSYDVSPDGLTYTFHLRDGVKWSDGTPVVAGDYEYSWKSALDPALASPTAGLLGVIKGAKDYNSGKTPDASQVAIKALDDKTLQVTLVGPNPAFLADVASAAVFWPIPQKIVQKFPKPYDWTEAANIVTNGPFTLSAWQHGASMTLVPNPQYWGPKPHVSEVDVTLFSDPTSQALAPFEAGDLDYALVPSGDIQRIQGDPTLSSELHTQTFARFLGIYMDDAVAPFNDVRVRQALYLAIDRDQIANNVLHGLVAPAWWNIPTGVPGSDPSIRLQGTVDDAKTLLAQAGYPNGAGFPAETMIVRNTDIEKLQAQAVQAQWKQNLGITVNIQILEADAFRTYQNGMRAGNPYQMMELGAAADAPDPAESHDVLIGVDGNGYYPTHFQNPEYTAALQAADAATDPQQRIEAYDAAEKLLIEKYTAIIPISNQNLVYMLRTGWSGLDFPFGLRGPTYANVNFSQ